MRLKTVSEFSFAFTFKTKTISTMLIIQGMIVLLLVVLTDSFKGIQNFKLKSWKSSRTCYMAREQHGNVVVVGVAADSGCGKSTFMRRLTKVFGGNNPGPLGGGFGNPGGWETNTLVSDQTTVICLDDYHINDRNGRKQTGLTALHMKEQNFDLMFEHIAQLKAGKSIEKPIYNHVNGTLDAPEVINPTPLVIVEGLHPMVDSRVRELLDFSIYLDISDEIKYGWKIHRDMTERGWTRQQVQADIDKRKPDFEAFVAPQMEFSDIVVRVSPSHHHSSESSLFNVKLIQKVNKPGFQPAYILDEHAHVTVRPALPLSSSSSSGSLGLASYRQSHFGHETAVLEMDGRVTNIEDFVTVENLLSRTSSKHVGEMSEWLARIGSSAPGSLDGTGLFQTLTSFKLRDYCKHLHNSHNSHQQQHQEVATAA